MNDALGMGKVVRSAIDSHSVVRLFVVEADARFPRIVEGVPQSIVAGRDGRERVVVAIDTATEHSEVRVPVDRVVRVEVLDATGNVATVVGEMPQERASAPRLKVDGASGPADRQTPLMVKRPNFVERDTQPISQAEIAAMRRRRTPVSQPQQQQQPRQRQPVDDRKPTEPAIPIPRRR